MSITAGQIAIFQEKKLTAFLRFDFNCMKSYETKLWPQTVNTEFLAVLYGMIKTNIHLITYCIHFSKNNYMSICNKQNFSKVYKLNLCLDKKQLHAKEKSRRCQRQSGSVFLLLFTIIIIFYLLHVLLNFVLKQLRQVWPQKS